MTVTRNIHIGLSGWATTTPYSTGNRVSAGGRAYEAITSGTSGATSPNGSTSADFSDGGVHWKYLSAIDYTSITAWEAAIPATLTDHYVGLIWNNGPITTTAGNPFFSIGTFGAPRTTGSFSITLKPAPGDSFRDKLKNANVALAYGASNGVAFVAPSATDSFLNYIDIHDSNVILDGLQFFDPSSASRTTLVNANASTVTTITNCILDAYAQPDGAAIVASSATLKMSNCLIIDRQPTAAPGFSVISGEADANSYVVNCTFISTGAAAAEACGFLANNAAAVVRNSIFTGYTTPIGGFGNLITVSYSVYSTSAVGNATDAGNNSFSKTAANQFISATTDFRIKSGSDARNTGATDTTRLPAATDIIGYARPQGTAWDIGASEFPWEISATLSLGGIGRSITAAQTNSASLTQSIPLGRSISAFQSNLTTLNRSIGPIGGTFTALQENRFSVAASIGAISSISAALITASATVSLGPIGHSIAARQERLASASSSIGAISASVSMSAFVLSGSHSIGPIATSAQFGQLNSMSGTAQLLLATASQLSQGSLASATVSIGSIAVAPRLRVSQSPLEVLASGGKLRVSQSPLEVLSSGGKLRVSQAALEVLGASPLIPSAHVSQMVAEVFVSGTPKARVSQALREVLTGGSGNESVRVSQMMREVLCSSELVPPVRISQIAIEVLVPVESQDDQYDTFIA